MWGTGKRNINIEGVKCVMWGTSKRNIDIEGAKCVMWGIRKGIYIYI